MEIHPEFTNYMNSYFDFRGLWDSPSKCGLRTIRRKDGKILVILTEIYRQNPGTAITDCIASLATQIREHLDESPGNLLFIEHTPDLKSRLSFYGESFDLVSFTWKGDQFSDPEWSRISREDVDAMMEM